MQILSSQASPNSQGARLLRLVMRKLLNHIVAIYLMVIGVWSLWWTAGYCALANTC